MASRRLRPEEAALWRQVAGSVRPLKGRARVAAPAGPPDAPAALPPDAVSKAPMAKPHKPVRTAQRVGQTLDGSWDKRIARGRLVPDRTIDLHGHNLSAAHQRLDRGLDEAVRDGARVVLLVTGHAPRTGASRIDLPLRGIIRESVGDWLAASRHRPAIAAVRNAHPRHGGAGALYIVLRRPG